MKVIGEQPTFRGWVSVKDRLPEKTGEYLVFTRENYIGIFGFDREEEGWADRDDYCNCGEGYVTHWLPLPEPPEEG